MVTTMMQRETLTFLLNRFLMYCQYLAFLFINSALYQTINPYYFLRGSLRAKVDTATFNNLRLFYLTQRIVVFSQLLNASSVLQLFKIFNFSVHFMAFSPYLKNVSPGHS